MKVNDLLSEQMYNSKTIDKLEEFVFLSYYAGSNNFSIIRFLKKLSIDIPNDWSIEAEFGHSFNGKNLPSLTYGHNKSKELGIFIQTENPDGSNRSESDIRLSIKHELIHILDYLKSISKNNGIVSARQQKKRYSDNPVSYYADPTEFNQLIHHIKQLSTKVKFKSYENLFVYLSADTFVDHSLLKDPSFMKRLMTRIHREKINIIKQKKPIVSDRLSS